MKGLMTISGLILVDARAESPFVVEEVRELFALGQEYKTVFIIGDDGFGPLLDAVDPDGAMLSESSAIVVREKEAADIVGGFTQSRESLPKRPPEA